MHEYLNLITSQHRKQPKYIAMISAYLRKLEDASLLLDSWDLQFSLEESVGKQLDTIGLLVGRSRNLNFQPTSGSAKLDDANYLLIIKAKILQNQWDGTLAGMHTLFKQVFPDMDLIIRDNQDMTMQATVIGLNNPLQIELLQNGYILPKPAGVQVNYSVVTDKIFAFDKNDDAFAGWDEGEWL